MSECIYFGGQRTARRRHSDGAVFYFFSDHLGSARGGLIYFYFRARH